MLPIGDVGTQAELYRTELLAQAERERLIQRVLAEQPKHNRWYCRALIWFGRQLVRSGEWLQEYHGAIVAVRQLMGMK